MITPKIVYDSGGGPVTLIPTYPPVQKPGADELVANRHDSITTTGVKQSINDRTDVFVNLNFAFVPTADLAAWKLFITWAIAGGKFTYYPDNTLGTNADYTLENDTWVAKRVMFSMYSFTLRLRLWVP
jgi:hypothetical protein